MISLVCELVHDPLFLAQKSLPAEKADSPVFTDLKDTLNAHLDGCVGMAANMIGVKKRMIVFLNGPFMMVMANPVITAKSGEYEAQEGCLSLAGVRKAKRWQKITVSYQDEQFRPCITSFQGFTAQIIQHEMDHCDGILI